MEHLRKQRKIVIILGPRQVGKTTLLNSIESKLKKAGKTVLYLNCDISEHRDSINTSSFTRLNNLARGYDYLAIDEAQKLDNPGLTLKIIHDHIPNVRLIATGSSSFELKNRLSDPLTGRFLDFMLYPFSLQELLQGKPTKLQKNIAAALLPDLLTFGSYPEVYLLAQRKNKITLLTKITESYLFRDILEFQKVRYSDAIRNLTTALAYQIGSEINENELSGRLKIDRKTVVSYLDILEKAFVITRLYPYSKNPRREIGRSYKAYFLDLGLRNALIGDFNPPYLRKDIGVLWENFILLERKKHISNMGNSAQYYFWRKYGGAEVDLLEKRIDASEIEAFELKYGQGKLSRGAYSFMKEYGKKVKLIGQENYIDFIV